MPGVPEFLRAFGLVQGITIGSFVLQSITAEHVVIHRYREYRYPITMVFVQRGTTDLNTFLMHLTQSLQGSKVVYTEYGNPYQCWIDTQQSSVRVSGNEVIVSVMGHSVRV